MNALSTYMIGGTFTARRSTSLLAVGCQKKELQILNVMEAIQ